MHNSPLERQFCAALISNNLNADDIRRELIVKLHAKKPVCSVGKCFNTVGFTLDDRPQFAENLDNKFTNPAKVAFSSQFKFTLALENSSVRGYCTEKITDAFAAGSVPIYWGDECISNEFNENSFIDVSKFSSIDDAIEFILKVDADDEAYMKMLMCNDIMKNTKYLEDLHKFLLNVIDGKTYEHLHGNIIN